MLARVRAAADPRATVEAYGSSVYAPAHASDVDILVVDDSPSRLATVLDLTLLPTTPPRLTGTLDGAQVDITIADAGDTMRRAAPRDAARFVEQLGDRAELFHAAWPEVRRFVRARALGGNGLGWFGSFGWAMLLAVPLVRGELATGDLPAWFRWLANVPLGTRLGFDGIERAPATTIQIVAPSSPFRDLANLDKRHASVLLAEARAASFVDLLDDPPPGATLAITFEDERGRGRYEGLARGLLRDLEAFGARSWGRFDRDADDAWQHRITVIARRASTARERIESWLATNHIDASVESSAVPNTRS